MTIRIALLALLLSVGLHMGRAQAAPGVTLAWDYTQSTDPAAQADSFLIERCTGSTCTNFVPLTTTPLPVTTLTYTDTTVQPGLTYRWQVLAKGPSGVSAPSNALTFSVPLPPQAPTNLRGTLAK